MASMRFLWVLIGLTVFISPTIWANDNGAPDTLFLFPSYIDAEGNDSLFVLEAWMFNDSNEIACQFGFTWDSDILYLDSVINSTETDYVFDWVAGFNWNPVVVNERHQVYFATISLSTQGYPPRPERHKLGTFYFTVNDWEVTSEITIDTAHWDDGSELLYVAPNGQYLYSPVWQYGESKLMVRDVSVQPCCGIFTNGFTGNTDCDVLAKRDLTDITRLIDAVYISKAPLCCGANGNVSGDVSGLINLTDITKLIDHVYISKVEISSCI